MPAVQRDGDYSTVYKFSLSAIFSEYPNEITFTHGPFDFLIRDYCVGMALSGPPGVMKLDNAFNISSGNVTEPWKFQISKYLVSGKSHFMMDYMSYTSWVPSGDPIPAINTGCGILTYNLTTLSWSEAWQGDYIISRPAGASYFSQTGTNHILSTDKRIQIGDHYALLEVKSELRIISTYRTLNFTLEILDCRVN